MVKNLILKTKEKKKKDDKESCIISTFHLQSPQYVQKKPKEVKQKKRQKKRKRKLINRVTECSLFLYLHIHTNNIA